MTTRSWSIFAITILFSAAWIGCGSGDTSQCTGTNCAPNDTQNSNDVGTTPDTVAIPDTSAAVDQGTTPTPDTSSTKDTSQPPVQNTAEEVNPDCIDGQYTEVFPDPNADISGLIANYSASQYMDFIYGVLDARFPLGSWLVEQGGGTE